MKVIFFSSPAIAGLRSIGYENAKSSGGGWSEALFDKLKDRNSIEAHYMFLSNAVRELVVTNYMGAYYHVIPLFGRTEVCLIDTTINIIKEEIDKIDPDIVHVWGTERRKTLEMIRIAGSDRCVISITGMVSVYWHHYLGDIDKNKVMIPSINDFLRRQSLFLQRRSFHELGLFEKQAIKEAKYVFGRTTWDYACVKQINRDIEYMHLNEALRPVFYSGQWRYENCKKHSIFVSQGSYPLKGLHKLLEAMPIVLEQFPDAHIYIAGPNIVKDDTLVDRIKRTTYGRYIINLMKKLNIRDKVTFVGVKNEKGMYEQYLSSNVFVMPSLIENSPNSLGEAMILGVPCVAAYVGGIPDMIKNNEEGFLYPFDEEYMLAHYICEIFNDVDLANKLSKAASVRARETHNVDNIISEMLKCYEKIIDDDRKSNK